MTADSAIVFVVDDDPSVRDGLRRLISSVGLAVEVFPTAQAFLRARWPDAPGCLVLDVRLPGLSGLDLQRELADSDGALPIIFLTGHGDIPMSVRAMKAGAVEFLTKPFREQDLLDAIRNAIERDRAARGERQELTKLRARYASLTLRERDVLAGGGGRPPQQADCRRIGHQRGHGQGATWARDAEDASRIRGRAGSHRVAARRDLRHERPSR
jgi:FixJ family two-component response regulator